MYINKSEKIILKDYEMECHNNTQNMYGMGLK